MKKLIIILLITFFGCSSNNVTIPKEEYNRLKGIVPSKYPKTIVVDNNNNLKDKIYVYLGSDGHEYQYHREYGDNAWTHYGGCELCKNRYDTLVNLIKNHETTTHP